MKPCHRTLVSILVCLLACAGDCRGAELSEQELRRNGPSCDAMPADKEHELRAAFEGQYCAQAIQRDACVQTATPRSIDVNGDGACDLLFGYQPVGESTACDQDDAESGAPCRYTLSEFYLVLSSARTAPDATFLRPAGDGIDPIAVYAGNSPVPFVATQTRDGLLVLYRWKAQSPEPPRAQPASPATSGAAATRAQPSRSISPAAVSAFRHRVVQPDTETVQPHDAGADDASRRSALSSIATRRDAFRPIEWLPRGELVQLDDDDPDAQVVRRFLAREALTRGVESLDREDYTMALARLNEAAAIDPAGAEISYALGLTKYAAARFADDKRIGERGASWYFNRAIKQGVGHYNPALEASAHFNLAKSYKAVGDDAGAAREFGRFQALEPASSEKLDRPTIVSRRMVEQAAHTRRPTGLRRSVAVPGLSSSQMGSLHEMPLHDVFTPADVRTKVKLLDKETLVRTQVQVQATERNVQLRPDQVEALTRLKIDQPNTRIRTLLMNPSRIPRQQPGMDSRRIEQPSTQP